MKYLIDTCVLSELVKPVPDANVLKWMKLVDEDSLYLSVLNLGEIQKGISKLVDSGKKSRLQTWLDQDLVDRFSDRILPVNKDVATLWGQVQGEAENRGAPIPTIDGLLGATARVFNLTLVSRNIKDINRTGCHVFNPWGGE